MSWRLCRCTRPIAVHSWLVVVWLAVAGCDPAAAPPQNPPASSLDEAKLGEVLESCGLRTAFFQIEETKGPTPAFSFSIPNNTGLALRDFEEYLKKATGTPLERLKRATQEAAIHAPDLEIQVLIQPDNKVTADDVRRLLGPEASRTSGKLGAPRETDDGHEVASPLQVTWLKYDWCSLGLADGQVTALKVHTLPFKGTPAEWKANRLRKGY